MNEHSSPTHRDTTDNGSLRDKAESYAEAQTQRAKEIGTRRLESTAEVVEQSAQGFDDAGHEMLARAARSLADEMQRFSSSLEGRSVSEMVGEFEHFARERPAVALGFAAAAGFALSRFLTASSKTGRSGNGSASRDDDDYLRFDEPIYDQHSKGEYAHRTALSDRGPTTAPQGAYTRVTEHSGSAGPDFTSGALQGFSGVGRSDDHWPAGATRGPISGAAREQSFTPAGIISPASDLTPGADAATPTDRKMAANADAVAMRTRVGSPDRPLASHDPMTSPEEDDENVR